MKKKRLFLGLGMLTCAFVFASCDTNSGNNDTTNSTIPNTTVDTTNNDGSDNVTTTNNTTTNNNNDNTNNNQTVEYDENGEPKTTFQAYELDLKRTNNASSASIDDSSFNVDTITNNSAITELSDEKSGLKRGTGKVVTKGEVNVTLVSGLNESAFIEYDEVDNATNYIISIKGGSFSEFTDLNGLTETENKNIYNDLNGRTDILGIKAGTYEIKITPVINGAKSDKVVTVCEITVESYDRSGYAHFNRKSTEAAYNGIGGYNDDGTVKDNAIILYVTDANKNTVELTYGGKTVKGIGNILNTVGQSCGEEGHSNECKKVSKGKTYYGTANDNQDILNDLANANIPLVIRFVGCVSDSGLYKEGTFDASKKSLIDGLTEYNSNNYGGSEGDNGHMARMKNAKNVTIEGVGENAILDGWGIHFICPANPENGKGSSFEVRNLTFMNTPEDAIGMEGQQESAKGITGAVERCWIHHNCFLKPSISSPAESDKSEGDGSCDFKRGRYYTLSYNYFEYCHKTNLIGSSDSSLQFDISVHHNYWYNCGSRITLTRQANVHFYNNYNYCDISDKNAELSYITSLRANCYIFSESNYFEGCKNVFQSKDGYAKCYDNTYVSCFGTLYGGGASEVANREDKISNGCKDGNIDLSSFDTNPELFYYDATNKKSDCYVTSSTVGRLDCINYSGSLYRTQANKTKAITNQASSKYASQAINAVDVPTTGELDITMPTTKTATVINNVYFNDISGVASGTVKFKGQGITFKLNQSALVTIQYTSAATGLYVGQIIRDDGLVMLSDSGTIKLSAGHEYYVTSTAMDKETTVSKLTFEKYDDAEYINKIKTVFQEVYANIPNELEATLECYNKIAKAVSVYNSIPETDRTGLENPNSKLESFINLYKVYTEEKISEIGTVSKESASKINDASFAYQVLKTISPSTEISNESVLKSAITSFENFAVDACKDLIDAIDEEITLASYQKIQDAITAYNTLTDEDSTNDSINIDNYEKLENAIAEYNKLYNANKVNNMIIEANQNDLNSITSVIKAYESLKDSEKELITTPNRYKNLLLIRFNMLASSPINQTSISEDLVSKVNDAYEFLTDEQKVSIESEFNDFKVSYVKAMINLIPTNVSMSDGAIISGARLAFDSLTQSLKEKIDNLLKLESAEEAYNTILAQTVKWSYDGQFTSNLIVASGNKKDKAQEFEGTKYNYGLKLESKNGKVNFTLQSNRKVIIYSKNATSIKLNGVSTNVNDGSQTIFDLTAGSYEISRDKNECWIYAIVIQ